ncbi:hypothetical protein PMG11_06823 [Penicillium brasilianum]|uniref:Uncharacterized protein n=1 Tax=Penicillium brasilianum TaxID=104259 RepID=A0A0F7TN21_PENBI|nr:hypothetical protein PMG11_06823 [Penicillium brasilianum]
MYPVRKAESEMSTCRWQQMCPMQQEAARLHLFNEETLVAGSEEFKKRVKSQGASQQAETEHGGLPTSILQKVVSSNNDAMNILYEAALLEGNNRVINEMPPADSALSIPRSLNETDALRIWNACRFVKMGWFSSHEAITLVDKSVHTHV